MRNKIMKIAALLAVMAAMTGIAVADPCPADPKDSPGFEYAKVVRTDSGYISLYQVQTLQTTSDFKIREVCVYNSDATKLLPVLTALFKDPVNLWSTISKVDYFGWNQNTGTNLIPLTVLGYTDVGKADWGTTSPPADQQYNLHISDNNGVICPKDNNPGPWTCFVTYI